MSSMSFTNSRLVQATQTGKCVVFRGDCDVIAGLMNLRAGRFSGKLHLLR